jgi:hypothetical protein
MGLFQHRDYRNPHRPPYLIKIQKGTGKSIHLTTSFQSLKTLSLSSAWGLDLLPFCSVFSVAKRTFLCTASRKTTFRLPSIRKHAVARFSCDRVADSAEILNMPYVRHVQKCAFPWSGLVPSPRDVRVQFPALTSCERNMENR